MKLVAYLAGVPSATKSPHKIEVLKRFVSGVLNSGDIGIAHPQRSLLPCDVGLIQGWVHQGSPNSPHLVLRKDVAENKKNKRTIIIDSNLFNYEVGPLFRHHYSRYSMDGVFPTTGNYFGDNPDPDRWKQISQELNLSLKDWRTRGDHILIACQRNGGWSMNGLDVVEWLDRTIAELRLYTDRPIIVRGHPGDKNAKAYLRQNRWNVSKNEKISQDLKNAWATITYNSSPGVASSIEGVPVFVTDPNPKISQAYDVANFNLADIENPKLLERQQWVEKLAMCHWKFEELTSGRAWKHMRNYV